MKIKIKRRLFKILLIILFIFIFIYQIYFIQRNNQKQIISLSSSSSSSSSFLSSLSLSSSSLLKICILLQLSPVQSNEQLIRLQVINNSWGDQLPSSSSTSSSLPSSQLLKNHFNIYAPLIITQTKLTERLSNIYLFYIVGKTPFYRLFESLISIIHNSNFIQYDWFIVGNDHSFIILKNLECFIQNLNNNIPIYSGNQLGLVFQGKYIKLASGGAGAVLSRPAILSILTIWTILYPNLYHEFYFNLYNQVSNSFVKFSTINIEYNMTIQLDHFKLDLKLRLKSNQRIIMSDNQFFSFLLHWNQVILSKNETFQLNVIFSKDFSLTINKQSNSQSDYTLQFNNYNLSTTSYSGMKKIQRYCKFQTKWDHDNPGVLLAACLQEIVNVSFYPAKSKFDSNLELFNVYGIVRMLFQDVDPWYREMKSINSNNKLSLSIPSDVISFHYVSQLESFLLHKILLSKCIYNDKIMINSSQLYSIWPRFEAERGPYSRRLYNETEAIKLLNLLCNHITISSC